MDEESKVLGSTNCLQRLLAAMGHAAPVLCCPLQWNKCFVLALTEENFLI